VRPRGSAVSGRQVSPATAPWWSTVRGVSANDRTRYLGERRRLMGPAEVTPVIVSRPTLRSENVAVGSDNFRRSPWTVPLTGPESSESAPVLTLPVTLVPFWSSDSETGTLVPLLWTYPDHRPATLAVEVFAAAICSSLVAAHPTAAMQDSARSTIAVAFIVASSIWPGRVSKDALLSVRRGSVGSNGTFGLPPRARELWDLSGNPRGP